MEPGQWDETLPNDSATSHVVRSLEYRRQGYCRTRPMDFL